MAFFGKKFQKSKTEGITPELLAALKVDEKYKNAGGSLNTFLKNSDGSYSFVIEVGGNVVAKYDFRDGEELTTARADGSKVPTKFQFDGTKLTQTQTGADGVVTTTVREFSDNAIKMTLSVSGVASKGIVYYDAV